VPKILLVEDNEANRDALSRRLMRRGYDVVMASDGRLGLQMAVSEKPDLILMDMNLPEIDGWEATRRLKADAATEPIPVIGLTAHALAGDRERALEAGCADYHTKPVEFAQLLAQIETALRQAP
jgi:CheY-like chemotaxis protein